MKTDKILIINPDEHNNINIVREIELEGYHVVTCLPTDLKEILRVTMEYIPDLVILLNLSNTLEENITVTIKESAPSTPVVTSTKQVSNNRTIVRFGSLDVTSVRCAESLIVNKLKIYLRLLKIKDMAEKLSECIEKIC